MRRDIGVIGGGVAGLTLAALLGARGHRVTVYERDRAGGKLRLLEVGGGPVASGPSLFTFPEVWRAVLARLGEADPLDLGPLPGGLGVHHTPHGPLPLPVPPGHPQFPAWQRYRREVSPLRPALVTLLTRPPDWHDPAFLRASLAVGRVLGPHRSAGGWLRARGLPPALDHALRTQALNAGLPPQDAPALYALLPALIAGDVSRPAGGMGELLRALLAFARARGVIVREGAEVLAIRGQSLELRRGPDGMETVRHEVIVSAADPYRLAALLGRHRRSPVRARTVSGVAIYAAFADPVALPATSVIAPGDFREFRAALHAGALPRDTLALVHAEGRRLAALLATPATGRALDLTHPWVRGQVGRVEEVLGVPGLLARALEVRTLDPAHYARGGHPGGALYGRFFGPWRAGPLHPEPYRLGPALWQVGTGVHPGGGLPAVLGGALIVDERMRRAGCSGATKGRGAAPPETAPL